MAPPVHRSPCRRAPTGANRSACAVVAGVELVEPREIILRATDGIGGARPRASPPAARSCGWPGRRRPRAGRRCRRACSTASKCRLAQPSISAGERGQLEIVRREQRQAAVLLRELVRDRPREREAVEGRGAAADLVDQHQALRRRAVQDRRRLGHLDHERRAPAGEIVGGADARVDRVERADARRARRHERAAVARAARSPPPAACRSTCRPCWGR